MVVNLSTEFGPLINAIDLIKSHGGSAIYDAVRKASEVMLRLPNDEYRKIIVLYTDGGDVNSRNTLAMLREFLTRRLQRASIDLIVVGVSGNTRLDDLRSLAEAANGTFFEATLDSVPDVFRKVRAML